MTELNKCCGEHPRMWVPMVGMDNKQLVSDDMPSIECKACGKHLFGETQKEVAEKWNIDTPDT